MKYILILLLILSSCSTERKCRKTISKAKKLGCLTTDSVIIKDTLIISSFDTLVKFTTLNEVDTLYAENKGIRTVVFTKWKTREVRVVQTSDTVIREIKVPQMVVKQTDCPKHKWWNTFKVGFLSFVGLLIIRWYALKQLNK